MRRKVVYLLLFLLLIISLMLLLFIKAFATLSSAGSLLQIPKQVENYEGIDSNIMQGIKIHLPTGAMLVSPFKDTDDEKIVKTDINRDGNDEVLYCYKNYGKEDELSLSVIFYKDNMWLKGLQIDKEFLTIDLIKFADLTGDKIDEILIGWKEKNSQMAGLDIYSWGGNGFNKIFSTAYSKLFIDDRKTNKFFGNRDKLIIWKANNQYYDADVIAWNNMNFVSVSEYYPEDFISLTSYYDDLKIPESNQNQYWYYKAVAYMAEKNYKAADECIDKAMSFKCEEEEMLAYRIVKGNCYTGFNGNKLNKALYYVINDISRKKNFHAKNRLLFDAYYYMGKYYYKIKDYRNALSYFDLSMRCCKALYGEDDDVYKMKVFKIKGVRAEAVACIKK